MEIHRIAIGSDHAGFQLKEQIQAILREKGYVVDDKGTFDGKTSCDYPDFALAVAKDVAAHNADIGVLVCSTGIGMSITANKVHGIRAALVHNAFEAKMTRRHNNANIICFGANVIGPSVALDALDAFLSNDFEGGRHQRRIDKMMAAEV